MDEFQLQLSLAIDHVVKLLVDKPDQVIIRLRPGGQAFDFQILVADDDLGKVIGKQGRTARAIRTLTAAFAQRIGRPISIDIAKSL